MLLRLFLRFSKSGLSSGCSARVSLTVLAMSPMSVDSARRATITKLQSGSFRRRSPLRFRIPDSDGHPRSAEGVGLMLLRTRACRATRPVAVDALGPEQTNAQCATRSESMRISWEAAASSAARRASTRTPRVYATHARQAARVARALARLSARAASPTRVRAEDDVPRV